MSFLTTSADAAHHFASETARGPSLIIAALGPRKTIALAERIVDLIQNHAATPESFWVVTLSDSAARELSTRIRNQLNSLGTKFNPNAMFVGTFHGLCLHLLDKHRELTRLKRNYTVMDPFDQHYFLYQRLKEYRAVDDSGLVLGRDATRWNQAQNLLKRLNALTEQALDTKGQAASHPEGRALLACYKVYLRQLEKANALDLSTIQLEALRLLEDNPEVLAQLRNRLAYLMVDDVPDGTTIQGRILRCLVTETPNPCVVGDDDDQIDDAFRGTFLDNTRAFPLHFENGFNPLSRAPQTETIPWWLM